MILPLVDTYTCGSSPNALESRSCLLSSRLRIGLGTANARRRLSARVCSRWQSRQRVRRFPKIAFSPSFHNRQNVIGIPQRLAGEPLEPPFNEKAQPVGPTRAAQLRVGSASVDSADCANAPVPLHYLLAKVARVGAEAPFVNTPIRAECKAPRRDFEPTPAAEGPAVAPFRQSGAIGEAAGHCPRST